MKHTLGKLLLLLFPVLIFAQTSYVYYSFNDDPWTFNRRDTDGSNPLVIYTPPDFNIYDAAVDGSIEKVYFHQRSNDDSWIFQSNYDGSGKTTVKTSAARYYSMAAGDGYIFYSYQDDPWSVRRCDSTGTNDIQLYQNPSYGSILKMAYDAENNYLYCYEYSYNGSSNADNRIFRINNEGSNLITVYDICPPITAMAAGAGYFYYQCNAAPWNFSRRNYDGTSETLIYTPPTGLVRACGYDAVNDKLYFYDHDGENNRYFYTSDPDGSNRTTFFSGFTQDINCVAVPCIDPSEVPLPIELASFTVMAVKGTVELTWTTESETENSHFLVYRDDEVIAQVDGAGTTTEQYVYSYLDTRVQAGDHRYAIADVTYGGVEKMHDAVTVEVGAAIADASFKLNKAYPNPFNPRTAVSFQLSAVSDIDLSIYSMGGEKVATLYSGEQAAGQHQVLWNAAGYPSGIYVVKLLVGEMMQTQKIVLMK